MIEDTEDFLWRVKIVFSFNENVCSLEVLTRMNQWTHMKLAVFMAIQHIEEEIV